MRYLSSVILQLGTTIREFISDFVSYLVSSIQSSTDPILKTCVIIIIICFSFTGVITVLLFIHRVWMQYRQRRIRKLQERYSLLLTGIIFDEQDEAFDKKRQKLVTYFRRKYLRSHFSKRVLRKELLALHKSLSGPSQEILETLYYELELHKEALMQMQDTDWSEKADAVRELSQVRYADAKNKILKLTTHENKVLRLEAKAAMLALNVDDPFGFLEKAEVEITEWQQLNLEEQAKRIDLKKIPDFSQWFDLENQSVVQFCIKMTSAYNQFESSDALIRLLRSKDERVVKESVRAIGDLLINEAQDELFDVFERGSPEIRDEILRTLGKIGGEEVITFLENLLYTGSRDMQLKAGVALRKIGSETDQVLQKALQSEEPWVSAVALHVLDNRI